MLSRETPMKTESNGVSAIAYGLKTEASGGLNGHSRSLSSSHRHDADPVCVVGLCKPS